VVLGTISQHDLIVGPSGVIGEQDGLAELHLAQMLQFAVVGGKGQFQASANRSHCGFQDGLNGLCRADFTDLFVHALQRRSLAASDLALAPAFQLQLQLAQLAARLVQVGGQALQLPVVQVGIEGD
jgi:hypothetical protein